MALAALDGTSGIRHGSIPKASVSAADTKRSVLLHFPPSDNQQLATVSRPFRGGRSVWVQPHTPETLYRSQVIVLHGVSLLTAPPHLNFITGNEGRAAPYTCTEVRSGKIIMPCNAARMKDIAMNKTNKPDLLLRLMLLFNNVTLVAASTLGSARPLGRG